MTPPFNLIDRLQVRAAMFAIGRSTLRSQGAPGMVAHARQYLRKINLQAFAVQTAEQFATTLDAQTQSLTDGFPAEGRGNWGAARKSLNIFLRDVVYCRPLCEHFQLGPVEPWLEVPLDSNVYDGLLCDSREPNSVPRWPGVKRLTPEESARFQKVAASIAQSLGVARVHLDVRYWRKEAIDALGG